MGCPFRFSLVGCTEHSSQSLSSFVYSFDRGFHYSWDGTDHGDVGKIGNYAVAGIFFVIGLYLLELIQIPFIETSNQPKIQWKGALAAFVIGLLFGLALGPCTFAYMAPMLAVVFHVATTKPVFAGSLIFSYAVGHCSVIVLAGTFTRMIQTYLNWSERSRGTVILKKICGVLVIFGGMYLIWSSHG